MNSIEAVNLVCPLDDASLQHQGRQWVCVHGHSYDIARQGYVNLLPVQFKRSRHPGDSKAMVNARQRFLNAGLYAPIAERLTELVLAETAGRQASCLLDVGCGEGYYIDYVAKRLREQAACGDFSAIGLDISKDAIVAATKRNRQITWVVGTNRRLPIEAASVDTIFCIFGFPHFAAFAHVLKAGGRVVLVDPGPDHLQELREVIYPRVRKAAAPALSGAEDAGFALLDSQSLQFDTETINHPLINDLLEMTPHLYRAGREGREKAGKLQALALTVDVRIRCLEKSQ